MRSGSYRLRWLVNGGWSWLTLRPGTRPRRIVRRSVYGALAFALERPRLAWTAHAVLRIAPRLKGHPDSPLHATLTVEDLSRHGRAINTLFIRAEQRHARRAG